MNTIHFEEKQRFKEIAFYILLGLLQALFLWGLIQQVIFNKPWGTKPARDIASITTSHLTGLVGWPLNLL